MGKMEEVIGKKLSPSEFARFYFDWYPFGYQQKPLECKEKKLMLNWGRQTGKSTISAIKALHFALWNDNSTVLILSPKQRQSNLLFKRMKNFITLSQRKLPELKLTNLITRETQTVLEFFNGSEIYSLPVAEDGSNIRGFTAHLIIIDETSQIKEDAWSSINPMIITTQGTIWLISTPRGCNNYFYEAYRNHKMGFRYFHAESFDNPLSNKVDIEADKERMPMIMWEEEYLAKFIDESTSFYPLSLIDSCMTWEREIEAPQPRRQYFLGLDPARHGKDSAVFCILERETKNIAGKFIETRNESIMQLAGRVRKLHDQFNFKKIAIDMTGMGTGLSDFLVEQKLPIEPVQFTIKTKEEVHNNLKIMMNSGNLLLLKNKTLRKQLSELKYEYTSMGFLKIYSDLAKSHQAAGQDDYPTALALAVWGARKSPEPIFVKRISGVFK